MVRLSAASRPVPGREVVCAGAGGKLEQAALIAKVAWHKAAPNPVGNGPHQAARCTVPCMTNMYLIRFFWLRGVYTAKGP